jgi:tetratricopeptide (TPR) repeat protein
MDLENPVVKLCVAGTQAEFKGALEEARTLYQQAWESARDDYEACIAAHYVARFQDDPEQKLHWNRIALERAEVVGDERVREFYPSLYLNMGHSYELLGDQDEARRYYDLAAAQGVRHEASLLKPTNREDGKNAKVNINP